MQAIGDSVARGLGMLGALSIIRFRTTLRNPRNIGFMFASLAAGISCGVLGFTIAIIGTLTFCLIAVILRFTPLSQEVNIVANLKVDTIIHSNQQKAIRKIIDKYCSQCILSNYKLYNSNPEKAHMQEYSYKIRLKDLEKAENKETELNLDVDCLITKVHASPGEEVHAGQLLLEAKQTKFEMKLEELKVKRAELERPITEQIKLLDKQLERVGSTERLQTQRFNSEKDIVNKEMAKLSVYAPTDGLIGNVHCIDGENVSAFNTLISFYERNPTLVKGFVHEKLILEVKLGDVLRVSSNQHPHHVVSGTVAGLGTRIVEIPERLRKIADFKTYGREVLIRIPADNPFLQKEKVTLNSATSEQSNLFSNMLN